MATAVAVEMAFVAIGWQVYEIHHRAFDLGLIGLAEFLPVPLLALPAGHIADRLPRVKLVMVWGIADATMDQPHDLSAFDPAPPSGRMEIEIGKDRRVIVDAGVDVAALARVLAVLARQ